MDYSAQSHGYGYSSQHGRAPVGITPMRGSSSSYSSLHNGIPSTSSHQHQQQQLHANPSTTMQHAPSASIPHSTHSATNATSNGSAGSRIDRSAQITAYVEKQKQAKLNAPLIKKVTTTNCQHKNTDGNMKDNGTIERTNQPRQATVLEKRRPSIEMANPQSVDSLQLQWVTHFPLT